MKLFLGMIWMACCKTLFCAKVKGIRTRTTHMQQQQIATECNRNNTVEAVDAADTFGDESALKTCSLCFGVTLSKEQKRTGRLHVVEIALKYSHQGAVFKYRSPTSTCEPVSKTQRERCEKKMMFIFQLYNN